MKIISIKMILPIWRLITMPISPFTIIIRITFKNVPDAIGSYGRHCRIPRRSLDKTWILTSQPVLEMFYPIILDSWHCSLTLRLLMMNWWVYLRRMNLRSTLNTWTWSTNCSLLRSSHAISMITPLITSNYSETPSTTPEYPISLP